MAAGALACLALALAPTPAPGDTLRAAAGPSAALAVSTTLHLTRGDAGELIARCVTTVRLPARDSAVRPLLAHVVGSSAYRRALDRLRDRIGLTAAARLVPLTLTRDQPSRLEIRMEDDGSDTFNVLRSPSPRVRIHDGMAFLTLVRSWHHVYYPEREFPDRPPMLPAWEFRSLRDHDIRFRAYGPAGVRVSWRLTVESEVGELVTLSPRPETAEATRASWTFPQTTRDSIVRLDLRPDDELHRYLRFMPDERDTMLSEQLSLALLGVVTLAWLLPVRPLRRSRATAYAARFAWITIATSLATIVAFLALPPLDEGLDAVLPQGLTFPVVTVLLTVPGLLVFSWLRASPWRPGRRRGRSPHVRTAVRAAVVGTGLVLALTFEPSAGELPVLDIAQSTPRVLNMVGAALIVLYAYLAVFGLLAALWTALPTDRLRRTVYRRETWVVLAGGAMTGLVILEWRIAGRSSLASGTALTAIDASTLVRWVPYNLLLQTHGLIVALLLLAIGSLLYSRGRRADGPRFAATTWTLAGACLLFGGAVVGMRDGYGDLVLPTSAVAGAAGLVLLCASRNVALASQAGIGGEDARTRLTPDVRELLIETALEHELDRQQERVIELRRARDELTADEARARLGSLYGPLPARLASLSHEGVARLALAVGPRGVWGANLAAATRLGCWLMLPALVYYCVVLYLRSEPLLTPSGPVVLGLLSQIAGEIARWLGAAAVMGMTYLYLPGRNGVIKGVSLAALFAAATGVVALFGDLPVDDWTFRATEMAVFLVALGVLMDLTALDGHRLRWRQLARAYRLTSVRVSASYAVPLLLLLFAFAQQLLSGRAEDGMQQLLESAPDVLMQGGR